MATPTYTLIDSTTLTSSAFSVTFSSITQDYRDLVLVVSGTGAGPIIAGFNSDTTTANYSRVVMYGTGSSSGSVSGNDRRISELDATVQSNAITQIMDYSATDKHKTLLIRVNQDGVVSAQATRWANTSAITSIDLVGTNDFDSGCVLQLFGIEA